MDQDIIIDGDMLLIKKSITKKEFKSEVFNRTTIRDEKTKETISRLIKSEFFSITEGEWWRYSEQDELIKAALNLGLTELASELTLFT